MAMATQVLKYVKNYSGNSDSATMLIYDAIGVNPMGKGIDGAQFANELFYLKDMGCKEVKIRVNSIGGSVMDGFSMFSAINEIKKSIPVNVYIDGMAASIAGVVSMAGTKVAISNYGMLMVHNPEVDPSAPISVKNQEILGLIKNSLMSMLSSKNNFSKEKLSDMMQQETWMTAEDCLKNGFVDEIFSSGAGKVSIPESLKNNGNKLLLFYNKLLNTDKKMSRLNTLLKLSNEASDESVANAVEALQSKVSSLTETLTATQNSLKEAKDALQAELDAKAAENEKLAIEEVTNAIKLNKITEADKTSWVALAKSDLSAVRNAFSVMGKVSAGASVLGTINNGIANPLTEAKAKWNAREWEKNDPKGWAELKATAPETFNQIFTKTYGATPKF